MSVEWVVGSLVAAIGIVWGIAVWAIRGWIEDLRQGKKAAEEANKEIVPAIRQLTETVNREAMRRELEQKR